MSTKTAAVIDVSIDISRAERLIAETLIETARVENKTAKSKAEIERLLGVQLRSDANLELIEERAEELEGELTVLEALAVAFRERKDIIENELTETETKLVQTEQRVEEVTKETALLNNAALAGLRRTAAFGTYVFQAMGFGVGQTLSLLAETATLAVQTKRHILELDIAESFASPWKAALTVGTIAVRLALLASLGIIIAQTADTQRKASQEFNSLVGAMRIITI